MILDGTKMNAVNKAPCPCRERILLENTGRPEKEKLPVSEIIALVLQRARTYRVGLRKNTRLGGLHTEVTIWFYSATAYPPGTLLSRVHSIAGRKVQLIFHQVSA